jgi:L-asparaginase
MTMRPTILLSVGGTIAMAADRGSGATPALDAAALVEAAGLEPVEARAVRSLPSVHLTLADALAVAEEAVGEAEAGRGVVVTTGTDTLEELAVLCDAMNAAAAPIVLTGAIRPASAPGTDGPANLVDAVAVAREAPPGAYVVFAGEVHAALGARKTDSTSPRAFTSPASGPLGRVAEGRVEWAGVAPERHGKWAGAAAGGERLRALRPAHLDLSVPIVPTWLGDDASLLRSALAAADALVLVALGAGHVPPPVLHALREARCPVAACVRPERGELLRATYGFEGAEGDLRATGAIPAAHLSPQAARMLLLAALGAGLGAEELHRLMERRA